LLTGNKLLVPALELHICAHTGESIRSRI